MKTSNRSLYSFDFKNSTTCGNPNFSFISMTSTSCFHWYIPSSYLSHITPQQLFLMSKYLIPSPTQKHFHFSLFYASIIRDLKFMFMQKKHNKLKMRRKIWTETNKKTKQSNYNNARHVSPTTSRSKQWQTITEEQYLYNQQQTYGEKRVFLPREGES